MKGLVEQYGPVALWVYLGIFGFCMALFIVLIQVGIQPSALLARLGWESKATDTSMWNVEWLPAWLLPVAGTVFMAWVPTKLLQPVRIALTFALTPVVGKLLQRRKKPDAG